jgi:L-asparaginase II
MSARVLVTRGEQVESVHTVHVAVTDGARVVARAGDPHMVTYLRSAAKPLQALPLVEDGVVGSLGITGSELALCCASHNAESRHVRAAAALLRRAGLEEGDLACGPHPPMRPAEAQRLAASGQLPRGIHNNCSGKHAGMLALAVHHGWRTEGYHRRGHAVQKRMRAEVARWSGVRSEALELAVDGCGVVTFALPLAAMAHAFARFGAAAREEDSGPAEVLGAMRAHPFMVAGTGRLCSALIGETGGRVVPKTGAEGVYCATLPDAGLGIALKVEDGARRAADVALVEVLAALDVLEEGELEALAPWRRPAVRNTRDERVGEIRGEVALERPGRRSR